MLLTIQAEQVSNQLKALRALANKAVGELKVIYLEVIEGQFTLRASNGVSELQYTFPTQEKHEPGYTYLDAKRFAGFIAQHKGTITLKSNEKGLAVKSRTGRATFPIVDEGVGDQIALISAQIQSEMPYAVRGEIIPNLFYASRFASEDRTKAIINSVRLSDGVLSASDGYRAFTAPTDQELPALTIDSDSLSLLSRSFPGLDSDDLLSVKVTPECFQVATEDGDAVFTTRTVAGTYPNVSGVVETQWEVVKANTPAQFDAETVIDKLKVFKSFDIVNVTLRFENGKLTLEGQSKEHTLVEELACEFKDDGITTFQLVYLQQALDSLDTDMVEFYYPQTPTQPVVMTPHGNADVKVLLMPVQIKH